MTAFPRVSVVMPVLDGQQYLNECIESILKQSFKDFEFIIIDDGSTDKTKEILSYYIKKDDRIKVITNQKRIGIAKSLNKGINIAQGDYIARQDADDISIEERLEKQYEFIKNNSEVKILGTFVYLIDKKGKIFKNQVLPISFSEIKKAIIKKNPFVHPSMMMEKKFIKKIGGYDEKFQVLQDYELWFRVLKEAKGENLPQFLVKKRCHFQMISIERKNEQLKNAIFLRKQAIREKRYRKIYYIYLLKPYILMVLFSFSKLFFKKNMANAY